MGIYPFEDYQNYSPYIHTANDLIGNSVNGFEMSQQYCQMNIACLAECAHPMSEIPLIHCNPVRNFIIEYPVFKDMSWLSLQWEVPEEGSTGELEHFEVYRDNVVIATVPYELAIDYYDCGDTITVGAQAEYFIMAVYSDGCEAPSETLIGEGVPTSVNEMENDCNLVYPNPSNGTFNLNLGEGRWDVVVYDITGRKVFGGRMDGRSVLDLGQCQKGVYFLKAKCESRGLTAKVVVQ